MTNNSCSNIESVITSINPADLSIIGEIKSARQEDIDNAVKQAQNAYQSWKKLSYPARGEYLLRVKDLILDYLDEIVPLVTQEMGKPISEVLLTEIFPTLEALTYFALNAERLLADEKIEYQSRLLLNKRGYTTYEPLGVIGIISPFSYPLAIPITQIATALIAGNTVILKPSELTPFIGLKIAEFFSKAELPEGCLSVLPGDKFTGELLVAADIDKILFTGRTMTGKSILHAFANRVLPATLELSGKAPMIILGDANIERAIKGAIYGAFINAGQSCCAVERIYVMRDIAKSFIDGVVKEVKNLTVSDPMNPKTEIGPLASETLRANVEAHIADAIQKGAKILIGGKIPENISGYFYLPTVLTEVDHSMQVMQDETFGPVMPIMVVDSINEAIQLVNDSRYGLSASVWTMDVNLAVDVAHKVETGTVTINDLLFTFGAVECAWGGTKESGIGRVHAVQGLREVCNVKHISFDKGKRVSKTWWYPYNEEYQEFIRLAIMSEYGQKLRTRFKSSSELLTHWRRIFGKQYE
ncbi:aldehyde dehydrogenase family protein [Candidatus Poribacteria bacterium]|nr:aldehyde dehydrogenase family protein [Candidatus Poribacteria bacterium]